MSTLGLDALVGGHGHICWWISVGRCSDMWLVNVGWCYSLRGWFPSGLRLLPLLDGFGALVLANLLPGRTRPLKRYLGHHTCLGPWRFL